MQVIEGVGDVLVIMEMVLYFFDEQGGVVIIIWCVMYVFCYENDGSWICMIDNFYGILLLDGQELLLKNYCFKNMNQLYFIFMLNIFWYFYGCN